MDLASLRAQQLSLAESVERVDRLDQDPPMLMGGSWSRRSTRSTDSARLSCWARSEAKSIITP